MIGAARGIRPWMAVVFPLVRLNSSSCDCFCCWDSSFTRTTFQFVNVATNSKSQLSLHYRLAATWGHMKARYAVGFNAWAVTVAVTLFRVTFLRR